MPQSRKRKEQRESHLDYIPHKRKRKSAIPVAMVFCALLSFGIAWFATGSYVPGLILGVAVGLIIGFIAGREMDKTFDKKNT